LGDGIGKTTYCDRYKGVWNNNMEYSFRNSKSLMCLAPCTPGQTHLTKPIEMIVDE
jgi:hypothetical protein